MPVTEEERLQELGFINPDFLKDFKLDFPEKKCLTAKKKASNDYIQYYIRKVKDIEDLNHIIVNHLTANQQKLLDQKMRDLKMIDETYPEEAEGLEVEIEDEDEDICEAVKGTMEIDKLQKELAKYEETSGLYIAELEKTRKFNTDLKARNKQLVDQLKEAVVSTGMDIETIEELKLDSEILKKMIPKFIEYKISMDLEIDEIDRVRELMP